MPGEIVRVGGNAVGEAGGHAVGKVDHEIDKAVESSWRQQQVTVVSDHRRLVEQPAAQGNAGRVELRQVQQQHIVLLQLAGGHQADRRHDDALVQARDDRRPQDADAIDALFKWCFGIELAGEHSDLMAPLHKGFGNPFSING